MNLKRKHILDKKNNEHSICSGDGTLGPFWILDKTLMQISRNISRLALLANLK